jgi:pimeloyl-ACP methyl ester carboxylesterase
MKNITLLTKDKEKISANFFKSEHRELVIIAPGWLMTKDSKSFLKISEIFAKHFDVLTLDFRGHGKSSGFYTFTARELEDIDVYVKFAKQNGYEKIYLLGFSLGAALVLIYASKSNLIDKVIAVSAPSEFGKIENQMWKKEAWLETLKKFEWRRFFSIRLCPIPLKKIKPIDIIQNISVPTLFIAGEKDPTVHSWHTEKLFAKARCDKKYKLFENGYHAEDLFLYFENEFSDVCLDWFSRH